MTAAEDYDLWLRILIDHEAGLLDEPLVTRRGGHPDQTSATTPALDRFRILALTKLLADDRLLRGAASRGGRSAHREMPHLRGGLARRGRVDEARMYEAVADRARQWSKASTA